MKTRIQFFILLFCSASLLLTGSARAQSPRPGAAASPTKSPYQMPDMTGMYSQMMNAMFTELTRPERAIALARFQKQYYDALVKEGFTKEEALSIVRATQLPFAGSK